MTSRTIVPRSTWHNARVTSTNHIAQAKVSRISEGCDIVSLWQAIRRCLAQMTSGGLLRSLAASSVEIVNPHLRLGLAKAKQSKVSSLVQRYEFGKQI